LLSTIDQSYFEANPRSEATSAASAIRAITGDCVQVVIALS